MKKRSILGIAWAVLAWPLLSQADLTIHIVQGVDKPYPVAIVPMANGPLPIASLPQGFSAVISNDLTMSGQFALTPTNQLPQAPHAAAAINWSQWQSIDQGLEFVVVGQVASGDQAGTYNVQFQLVSVLSHRALLGQIYHNVPANQLRNLAHHISDLVYQTITGMRGIFSTRLAYVEVAQGQHGPLYRLLVSDADGYNSQLLLQQPYNPIASPIWSPNGQELAYVTYWNNRMVIDTITLATGERHMIAAFPGINSAPAWSPNGQEMAMALSMGHGAKTDLYLMNLKTRHLTRLTDFATNTSPRFSPDGQHLLFTSDRSGEPQIYQMNLQTRQTKRLTFQGFKNFSAVYTPDGQSIVFMYQGSSGDGAINIAKLNLSSGVMQVLTDGNLDKSPSIAPNGQMLIYANYDGTQGVLAETSINGRIHLQLPATQGSAQSPAWSPFLTP